MSPSAQEMFLRIDGANTGCLKREDFEKYILNSEDSFFWGIRRIQSNFKQYSHEKSIFSPAQLPQPLEINSFSCQAPPSQQKSPLPRFRKLILPCFPSHQKSTSSPVQFPQPAKINIFYCPPSPAIRYQHFLLPSFPSQQK